MIIAMLILPGIDAIAKYLSGVISPGQVAWSRFFFQILLMYPLLFRTRGPWFTPALWLHAARGCCIAGATLLFFTGLKYLPIADAISIFFIEPMLVTLLSALLLGETVGWRRLSAIVIGFCGALIIIRPTFSEVGWPVLYPVGAAFCFAFYILLTRKLVQARRSDSLTVLRRIVRFHCDGYCAGAGYEKSYRNAYPGLAECFSMGITGWARVNCDDRSSAGRLCVSPRSGRRSGPFSIHRDYRRYYLWFCVIQ